MRTIPQRDTPSASDRRENAPGATESDSTRPPVTPDVSPTVDELRNEIRLAVDRFERPDGAAFTKESLAAICAAVEYDVGEGRLPPKAEMRAAIAARIDGLDDDRDPDRAFRKAELDAIADRLGDGGDR